MRKRIVSIITVLTICIVNTLPLKQVSASEVLSNKSDVSSSSYQDYTDTPDVKNCIDTYFKNTFESIKQGQAVNQDNIIADEKLRELSNLTNERKAKWYKALDDVILDYNVNINYKSINYNNDECTVDLLKDIKFSFTKSPNIVSEEFGIEHVITLKKINNNWLIENDIDLSNEDNAEQQNNVSQKSKVSTARIQSFSNEYSEDINSKILCLKDDMNNLENEINGYKKFKGELLKSENNSNIKNNSAKSISTYGVSKWGSYNWQAAVNYAHQWAYSYNPNYPKLDGADCTNFVSQCIYAGAPAMNLGARWYVNSIVYGKAWACVPEFWNFLISNNGSGPISVDNSQKLDICEGDPVQFYNKQKGMYSHTVIITSDDGMGGLGYSAHSNSRRDYPLDSVYSSGTYDFNKQRTAHILGYYK